MAKNGFGFEVRKESIHEKPITNQTAEEHKAKRTKPNLINADKSDIIFLPTFGIAGRSIYRRIKEEIWAICKWIVQH